MASNGHGTRPSGGHYGRKWQCLPANALRRLPDGPVVCSGSDSNRCYRMFSRVKIAIRFFFVGLVVGVLLAPRSGRATRRLLRVRADRLFNDLLDTATLGAYETGPGDVPSEEEGDDSNGQSGQATTRKKAAAPAQS